MIEQTEAPRAPVPQGPVADDVCIQNLLDASAEIIYFKDLESRFTRVSLGYAHLHGRSSPDELLGLSDRDLFGEAHARATYADEQRIARTGVPMINQVELETRDGFADAWVASSKFPLVADGVVIGTFGISRDVTARVLAEQTALRTAAEAEAANEGLRRAEQQLRAVLEGSSDAIARYDDRLRYVYLNPAGEAQRGVPLAALRGRTDRDLKVTGLADDALEVWEAALREVLATGRAHEVELTLADHEDRWFHARLSPDVDLDGHVVGVLASTRDVTDLKEAQRLLAHQATHDPMTDVANRTLLMDRLTQALLRLRRRPGRVALLFVDVDRFKPVNDAYGHAAGDSVLVQLAGRLVSAARAEDTVARVGGDEFVVLCEGLGADEHVEELTRRLCSALAPPFAHGPRMLAVSTSVGVAVVDDGGTSPTEVLRRADAAMYEAKRHGGGGSHITGLGA